MTLGFYYHTGFVRDGNLIYVPGFLGVFIDELAKHVSVLYLYHEEIKNPVKGFHDYKLQSPNIQLVSLGYKKSFVSRLLFASNVMRTCSSKIQPDVFLVRMPSPLGPGLIRWFTKRSVRVFPLIVGDYLNGLSPAGGLKNRLLYLIYRIYNLLQQRSVKNLTTFVNSNELKKSMEANSKACHLIKTTTLSEQSFYYRTQHTLSNPVRLLYTGRISREKGLSELLEALAQVNKTTPVSLDIVGWEDDGSDTIKKELIGLAEHLQIPEHVHFHGKQSIGPALNFFYKQSDIYIIPSYHEGFPRTIWEAMAHGLPVIATRVGSIPYYVNHLYNGYLIEPRNTFEITEAIQTILKDATLRTSMCNHAYELVKDNTLEKQTKYLIERIHDEYTRN